MKYCQLIDKIKKTNPNCDLSEIYKMYNEISDEMIKAGTRPVVVHSFIDVAGDDVTTGDGYVVFGKKCCFHTCEEAPKIKRLWQNLAVSQADIDLMFKLEPKVAYMNVLLKRKLK